MDERLELAWRDTLASTARPATWAARQRAFREGAAEKSAEARRADQDSQIAALDTERRYAKAMPRQIGKLDSGCIGRALRDCRILASGRLPVPDGPDIRWQTQRGFTEEDGTRGGVVLLERRARGFAVIAWSFEGYDWQSPRVIAHGGETLLTVAGRVGGTGNHNADLLFRKAGSAWNEIELESWKGDIKKHLPAGLGVWKGVDYDFQTMTARMPVWNPEDANCCPTAGSATASLQIGDNRLVLNNFSFTRRANTP